MYYLRIDCTKCHKSRFTFALSSEWTRFGIPDLRRQMENFGWTLHFGEPLCNKCNGNLRPIEP